MPFANPYGLTGPEPAMRRLWRCLVDSKKECEVLVDSDVTIKAKIDFQLESLILAQNERWRQA